MLLKFQTLGPVVPIIRTALMTNPHDPLSDHNLSILDEGNPPHRDAGLFGSTISAQNAALVMIPVPWEATTSYGRGTARGPQAVLRASHQLDLSDPLLGEPYRAGICLLPPEPTIVELNDEASQAALRVIEAFESAQQPSSRDLEHVNLASKTVNSTVRRVADQWLSQNKICAVLGGDHSAPFGLMESLAAHGGPYDILHIDAHHDLRKAYEGFEDSHASIMYNVLERIPEVSRLVQVGIRDYSKQEQTYAQQSPRVIAHYDRDLFMRKAEGAPFAAIARQMVDPLGPRVYISFDIDGLEPSLCPHTGTPVPGGLSFQEAIYLIELLVLQGKEVIGFDLCEVAPGTGDWDANVGARILYKLCGASLYRRRTTGVR